MCVLVSQSIPWADGCAWIIVVVEVSDIDQKYHKPAHEHLRTQ